MTEKLIRRVLILGMLAIVGIIAVQSYWLIKTWDIRDNNFDRSIHIALRNVAQQISNANKSTLPSYNIVQRRASNVYIVNVNSKIKDFRKLEDYLHSELTNVFINTDFEYAVYDCATSELIYGNYHKMDGTTKPKKKSSLPKLSHLDYYFVVKFPERESYVVANFWTNIVIFSIAILSVLFFTYSILVILRQKRLSDLQKDFINNMTHEFKTPISSIKIAADIIQAEENIKNDPRLNRYAHIIKDQNNRLNDQVEKVLNIARLENDTLQLNKEEIELCPLIQNVVEATQLKMTEGTVTFDHQGLQPTIYADKLHITNLIYNILDNAIKYCDKTPIIHLSLNQSQKVLSIRVKDNGIGIAKENIKYLFDKFYRVNTGNIHNVKGFGLGLFYVKSICKAHGWDIHIESDLGKGSTFEINIPTAKTI